MTPVPIQRLRATAREAYLAHLLELSPDDARLRFGASLPRDAIAAYASRVDFERDAVFGVHADTLDLVGVAHLALAGDAAELGLSVLPGARRHGIGRALIARATEHARNRFKPRLFMHCLAENAAMIRLARHAGMDVVVESGDADAHVALSPANALSVTSEMLADRVALFDYALKSNVETWRRVGVAMARPA